MYNNLDKDDSGCDIFGGKMTNTVIENWINIDEAAVYLGVKPGTISGWIKNNKVLPAHKIGKLWKFKRSELDAWIESGKSASIL